MRNRKFVWLTLMAFPGVLLTGCWAALHNVVIHGFEITDFFAALRTLEIL